MVGIAFGPGGGLGWPVRQHPGLVPAGEAQDEQLAQVQRGDPDRQPHVVALDPVVGHPSATSQAMERSTIGRQRR
jgi:hypothetical protein